MGEHASWFEFLPGVTHLEQFASHYFRRTAGIDQFPTAFTLQHVFHVALVFILSILGAVIFARAMARGGDEAVVPSPRFDVRSVFEMITDAVMGIAEGVMGEHNARRFLPLLGTLAFFIFFSNCLALLPGFAPPTAVMKTNIALALTVFFVTHAWGIKEHGLSYFKHFLGPVWWLAWLMLPIEIVSHLARPMSLTLRLLGNIFADHAVVGTFFFVIPLLVPLPFMMLGVLVCIVQTLVFCLLSMIYIQGAVGHEEH